MARGGGGASSLSGYGPSGGKESLSNSVRLVRVVAAAAAAAVVDVGVVVSLFNDENLLV